MNIRLALLLSTAIGALPLLGGSSANPLTQLHVASTRRPRLEFGAADSVVVERIPERPVLIRTVKAPFSRHVEEFTAFMKYAEANYRTVGRCFGIYPVDPDAVDGDPTWQIGVEVTTGKAGHVESTMDSHFAPARVIAQLRKPMKGYSLSTLPAIEAATVKSDVAHAGADGLRMFKWLADNGYVQVGPTRMEYLSHDLPPQQIPTRIIVPVERRKRDIRPAR